MMQNQELYQYLNFLHNYVNVINWHNDVHNVSNDSVLLCVFYAGYVDWLHFHIWYYKHINHKHLYLNL